MKKIISKVQAAINKYDMIENGDKIAVGLSGGKDSVTLLYVLSKIRTFGDAEFNVKAITLDPCFYDKFTDYSEITELCDRLGIEHIIKRHPVWKIVFEVRNEKNPCSLCSRMRHGILHNICNEQGCNKIALGHNSDDAVETFLMNIFYGGRISTFSPKSYLSRKNLHMIRPLIFCGESEIRKFAEDNSLSICRTPCPKDKNSARETTKKLIESLEKSYPNLKKRIFNTIKSEHISQW